MRFFGRLGLQLRPAVALGGTGHCRREEQGPKSWPDLRHQRHHDKKTLSDAQASPQTMMKTDSIEESAFGIVKSSMEHDVQAMIVYT